MLQDKPSQPSLVAEQIPQLSNVEILLRDMLAEKEAKIDVLQEIIWQLKEENGRLKEQLRTKGGDVQNAVDSSSAVA
jgi:predicted nuclease with TOPRIM domain